jgi:uncharacterized protein
MQRRESRIDELIAALGLVPHPEGGYYNECYKSEDTSSDLPERFPADRGRMPFCTSIFYLLGSPDYSTFHRIAADELWYFHEGTGMLVHAIEPDGAYRAFVLGPPGAGRSAVPFCAVRAGSWFGAEPLILGAAPAEPTNSSAAPAEPGAEAWALVSCAVSPGFDYRDFEMAKRGELAQEFPRHRAIIERLTKG